MAVFASLHREIGQKCPQELSRDPAGAKGFAAFLTELAERIPAILMSSMCVLLDHLDGEVRGPMGISGSSGDFKSIAERQFLITRIWLSLEIKLSNHNSVAVSSYREADKKFID